MKKLIAVSFVSFALFACSKKEESASAPAAAAAKPAEAPKAEPAAAPAPAPAAEAAQLSCTNSTGSQCTDYLGGDPGLVKDQCGMISGTFASSACSQKAKNRLGTCELSGLHKRVTYYGGAPDNDTAANEKQACASLSGTWQP